MTRPHITHHHACDCREAAFERLRKATERLIATWNDRVISDEAEAAIEEAREALEETKP